MLVRKTGKNKPAGDTGPQPARLKNSRANAFTLTKKNRPGKGDFSTEIMSQCTCYSTLCVIG